MTSDAEILAIKQDMRLLLQMFSASRPANHNPCPFCGDKSALSIFTQNHSALFRCHKCEEKGDIFAAYKLLNGLDFSAALAHIKGDPTIKLKPAQRAAYIKQSAERPVPVLDMDKVEKMVTYANGFLLDNMHFVNEYERGLSREVVEKYRIGFLYNQRYRIYDYGDPYLFNATWVLPITDEDGVIKGVKLHHQIKPMTGKGQEFKGKCSWAPFGTEPKQDRELNIHPVHSFYTLWPHPDVLTAFDADFSMDPGWWVNQIDEKSELQDRWYTAMFAEQASIAYALGIRVEDISPTNVSQAFQNAYSSLGREIRKHVLQKRGKAVARPDPEEGSDPLPDFESYIFITPGELKALALISEGFIATAVTGGESWTPHSSLLESLRGQRVCLFWDDDLPSKPEGKDYWICAGKTWAAKMTTALKAARVKEIISISGGRKIVGTKPVEEKVNDAQKEEEVFEV